MPEYNKLDVFMKILEIIEHDVQLLPQEVSEEQRLAVINVIQNIEGGLVIEQVDKKEVQVGDKYIAGQVGARGPGAHAHDMTFNQVWNDVEKQIDLEVLAADLSSLRDQLQRGAVEPEHHVSLGAIASAELAAKEGNGPAVMEALSNAGKWAFDNATKIGVGVAVAALIRQ